MLLNSRYDFKCSDTWGYTNNENLPLDSLIGDAFEGGNILRDLNDYRLDPLRVGFDSVDPGENASDGTKFNNADERKANAAFVEVLHNGWYVHRGWLAGVSL